LVQYLGRSSDDHVSGIALHARGFFFEVVVPIHHLHKCVKGLNVRLAVHAVDSTLCSVEDQVQVPTD
jgi:hypothetical protein